MIGIYKGVGFQCVVLVLCTILVAQVRNANAEEMHNISGFEVFSNSVMFEIGTFWQLNRTGGAGLKLGLGYDRAFKEAGWFTMGPRIGMLENSGTTAFTGLRALFWTGNQKKSFVRFKLGGAFDLWINLTKDDVPLCLIYIGGETGLRFRISENLCVDFPIEFGVLPYFTPKVLVIQIGSQMIAAFCFF